ncbi:hypothetical protein C8F04DRAFT_1192941 [Mycena alexandri]|uniref:Uncharacterized protein n=1 Tax=Mycena alexandri TaxID=1745969 RepID=A0AAD6WT26_9AGAR|nr:hypothetical protein C8F04DRAFT_1192941 [Mycena alexandri]
MPFLLGLLSLVPNNYIRYTTLALIILFWVACSIHIKCPSVQMSRLIDAIEHAERTITMAKAQYTRYYITFVYEELHLLEVKQRVSNIRDHMLNARGRTGGVGWTACTSRWETYRLSCRELTACVRERAIEVERARKIAAEIEECRSLLRFQVLGFDAHSVEYA